MPPPTMPGDEYGIYIPDDRAENARLFLNRKALLAHCGASLPDKPVVAEVGVFQGYFSDHILKTLTPGSMHLIDTFAVDDHVTHLFTSGTHHRHILDKFATRPEVHVHRGMSWDMLAALPDASLDFAYIDADHGYESVTRDIRAVLPKMRPDGIIQFNDYTHFGAYERAPYGVLDAVNEFIEEHRPEVIGLSLDRSGMHDLAVRVKKKKRGLAIVTPCSRPENLPEIFETVRFDLIDTWYIVYDTRHAAFVKRYDHPQIVEMECGDEGVSGNACRNRALDVIGEGMVYFLDDDNLVHPEFWKMSFAPGRIHTFDMQYSDGRVLPGTRPVVDGIDTAQCVVDVALVGPNRWVVTEYAADGMFINAVWEAHKDKWVYHPVVASHYNRLRE